MAGTCIASRRLGASLCMASKYHAAIFNTDFPSILRSSVPKILLLPWTTDRGPSRRSRYHVQHRCPMSDYLAVFKGHSSPSFTLAQKALSSKNASLQHLYLMY